MRARLGGPPSPLVDVNIAIQARGRRPFCIPDNNPCIEIRRIAQRSGAAPGAAGGLGF